jgi:hypothetical protein
MAYIYQHGDNARQCVEFIAHSSAPLNAFTYYHKCVYFSKCLKLKPPSPGPSEIVALFTMGNEKKK